MAAGAVERVSHLMGRLSDQKKREERNMGMFKGISYDFKRIKAMAEEAGMRVPDA